MSAHRIEGAVTVWLLFNTDTGRWEVDPLCFDGDELDSAYDLADEDLVHVECDSNDEDEGAHDETACAAIQATARQAPLPTGHRLITLLQDAHEHRAPQAGAQARCAGPGQRHRPDDDPTPGDRCKDCGRELTWTGPDPNDWTPTNQIT